MAGLWVKNGGQFAQDSFEEDNEDVWDDTALIEAYDSAINSYKNSLNGKGDGDRPASSAKKRHKKKQETRRKQDHRNDRMQRPEMKWNIGDECKALYYFDGLTYDGIIIELLPEEDSCVVRFDHYENEEIINLGDVFDKRRENNGSGDTRHQNVDDTHKRNHREHSVGTWNIGDVCLAMNPKTGKEEEAVIINLESEWCDVTLTRSKTKHKVHLTSLKNINLKKTRCQHECRHHHRRDRSNAGHHSNMFPGFPSPFFPPSDFISPFQPPPPPHLHPPSPFRGFPESFGNTSSVNRPDPMIPPPPPPPPMAFPPDMENSNDDALANMLMSWYMVGYHTGYYQALKRRRERPLSPKNSESMEPTDTNSDTSTKPDI